MRKRKESIAFQKMKAYLADHRRATGCNSRAGEARGAGSVSPTVLPENEDGLAERRPANRPTDLTVQVEQALSLPFGTFLVLRGRGSFAVSLPLIKFKIKFSEIEQRVEWVVCSTCVSDSARD